MKEANVQGFFKSGFIFSKFQICVHFGKLEKSSIVIKVAWHFFVPHFFFMASDNLYLYLIYIQ